LTTICLSCLLSDCRLLRLTAGTSAIWQKHTVKFESERAQIHTSTQLENFCTALYLFHIRHAHTVETVTLSVCNPCKVN
jgi:hypothetical protein